MPNTSDYVTWATGAGANIAANPAAYAAMSIRQLGAQIGIADPVSFNQALRQASVVAAMIGQFTADHGPSNVIDDGNVSNLEAQYLSAIQAIVAAMIAAAAPGQNSLVHFGGTDTGTANSYIFASPVPSIATETAGLMLIAKAAHANTAASVVNVAGLGSKAITRGDLTALQAGDISANELMVLVYDGTQFQLASSPTTAAESSIINEINISTPRGSTKLSSFTANVVASDIAANPSYTTVQTTGNFTGATYADCSATCSLFDNASSGTTGGGTVRLALTDTTANTVTYSNYVGGGSQSQATQVCLIVPRVIYNLNPTHTYNLTLVAQKGASGVGPTEAYDTYIFVQHDGNNL